MARWLERRGYTLRLARDPAPHWVRISVVERRGWTLTRFNVRETRAETPPGATPTAAMGDGRMLSWRTLRESDADRLLQARLRALRAMGYLQQEEPQPSPEVARDGWEWLQGLVRRGLAAVESPASAPTAAQRLRQIFDGPSRTADALLDAIADTLELTVSELCEPEPMVVPRVDPEALTLLLPFVTQHPHPEVRAVARRWWQCSATPYQVPRQTLLQWLLDDGAVSALLVVRLDREALALLGPEALQRLARDAQRGDVRTAARSWTKLLHGHPPLA